MKRLKVSTHGERFYDITSQVKEVLNTLTWDSSSGVCFLFVMHTSCALCINESYDPKAKEDLESFLKRLAPRDADFITHDDEGPDDSPSHMKSLLLQQSLAFPVENKQLVLGTWQGIYLSEFRDAPHEREIIIKFVPDPH